MTTANGGTYARQYPCDGWVDTLEPTLCVTRFLIQGYNLKKTIMMYRLINYLQSN